MKNLITKPLLIASTMAISTLAVAHPNHSEHGENTLLNGIYHPISGADHILALLALGLWAASLRGKLSSLGKSLPMLFTLLMLPGFLMAYFTHFHLDFINEWLAASLLVFGLGTAFMQRLSVSWVLMFTAAFAFAHGALHATGAPSHLVMPYVIGFMASSVVVAMLGYLVGKALSLKPLAIQITGVAMGIFGVFLIFA